MNFDIVVHSDGSQHVKAFAEMAETLQACLVDLGHTAVLQYNNAALFWDESRELIVFGVCREPTLNLRPSAIIYNAEQIGSAWFSPALIELYDKHRVLEYSLENAKLYASKGLTYPTAVVPFGYHPSLERITRKPAEELDIDVLHVGWLNDRRTKVITELENQGLNVVSLVSSYGEDRDAYIARTKLLLNVHYYETGIFEQARVIYAAANKIPVVTEVCKGFEKPNAITSSSFAYLPNMVFDMRKAPEVLEYVTDVAYRQVKEAPMLNGVQDALVELYV